MQRGGQFVCGLLLVFSPLVFSSTDHGGRTARARVIDCTKKQTSDEMCMACAIAMEAGNQPLAGQKAVAMVIMNRVYSPRFPDTICGVVNQKRREGSIRHAFSFLDDDISEKIRSSKTAFLPWRTLEKYLKLGRLITRRHRPGHPFDPKNPGSCATFYATAPAARRSGFFRKHLVFLSDYGDHRFYRDRRDRCGSPIRRRGVVEEMAVNNDDRSIQ